MKLVTFPLRVKPEVRQAIRDRAKMEKITQTALIRKAVNLYLLTPYKQKTAS